MDAIDRLIVDIARANETERVTASLAARPTGLTQHAVALGRSQAEAAREQAGWQLASLTERA